MLCFDATTDSDSPDDFKYPSKQTVNWSSCENWDATLEADSYTSRGANEQAIVLSTIGCRQCKSEDDDEDDTLRPDEAGEPYVYFSEGLGIHFLTCLNQTNLTAAYDTEDGVPCGVGQLTQWEGVIEGD